VAKVATCKLVQLDAGSTLECLRSPPGSPLEALAKALHVPTPRINEVMRKRRGVSADTAMRLARYFGGDARSWLNLQTAYDLRIAEISNARHIVREISPVTMEVASC